VSRIAIQLMRSLFAERLGSSANKRVKFAWCQLQAGKREQAEQTLKDSLDRFPNHPEMLQLLGDIAFDKSDYTEAIKYYRNVIKVKPSMAEAHCNLAYALRKIKKLDAAARHFERALEFQPDNATIHNDLGITLQELGKTGKALHSVGKALQLQPDFFEAQINYGLILREQGKHREAFNTLLAALSVNPRSVSAHCNIAAVLREMGECKSAVEYYQKAIQLDPSCAEAHSGLGSALMDLGQVAEAFRCFDRALEIQPQYAEGRSRRAFAWLSQGNFERGWADYEARYLTQESPERGFPFPQWDGSSLDDKTILLYGEQGLGDQIMFASCFPDVITRAKHCVVECETKLAGLFARSFPNATVHGGMRSDDKAWLKQLPKIDVQSAIGSLPRYFRNRWEDFPRHKGYLKADLVRVGNWRDRLTSLGREPKIGISWRGGIGKTRSPVRSLPLSNWLPILSQSGVSFVSLQYGECADEIIELKQRHGIHLHHWAEAIEDYEETAALICSLDCVISVCTSVVHLTGALDKPVWVMAPFSPEWRYLRQEECMPWYPSAKVFRQPDAENWAAVIQRVVSELRSIC
jgi:tetratricopeptide (TPR) repeat protein